MSFIRRKRTHRLTSEGRKDYFYYQLVVSERIEGSKYPKQRVLEHLGDASTAIANLEASEATDEDKSKLLPNLQELIAAELGDVVEPSED